MSSLRWIAIAVLFPFGALTAYALLDVGFVGVFQHQFDSSGGWQVLADLVIAIGLISVWMVVDARRTHRNPWPYVGLALVAGSFGPLLYLALTPRPPSASASA